MDLAGETHLCWVVEIGLSISKSDCAVHYSTGVSYQTDPLRCVSQDKLGTIANLLLF
jgi:uncharacterized protein YfcZ (UPF0381/DUF406 family)